mmetsp:Transcript_6426/g.19440  ORF Transcript_6426/g.19440 Transcript_6426/m.19440 type:complete len:439 (+) Transcript_6426:78-1394(+)
MTAKVAAFIPLHFALAMEGAALRPLALAELSRVQRAEATCAAHARGISEGALGDAAEEASLSQLAQVAQRFDRMQTTGKTAAGNLTAVERWQQHFVDAVADEATLACRIGSIDGCKCSDGTSGTYCCMDGKMINSGSGGGSPVAGTVWRWFRRDGAEWHCTEANECPHYEVTTYQPGADPPFESPTRGADIFFASEDATCNTPRVLFIHGGAWNSGAPNEIGYFTTGSRLARDAGAVVMAIDYPLARTCFRQAEGGCFDTERANQTIMRDWAVSALEYLAGHVPNIPGTKIPGEGCSNEAPLIIGGDSSPCPPCSRLRPAAPSVSEVRSSSLRVHSCGRASMTSSACRRPTSRAPTRGSRSLAASPALRRAGGMSAQRTAGATGSPEAPGRQRRLITPGGAAGSWPCTTPAVRRPPRTPTSPPRRPRLRCCRGSRPLS